MTITKLDLEELKKVLDRAPLRCKLEHIAEEDENGLVILRHTNGWPCLMMLKEDYKAIMAYKETT